MSDGASRCHETARPPIRLCEDGRIVFAAILRRVELVLGRVDSFMNLTTRRLFLAILFLALVVIATREISDPDFWWHLRTGQYIIETRAIPRTDPFSLTRAGHPWVTHEWLAEVFLYALYTLGAFPLLSLTFAVLITLTLALVYARMRGKPYLAAFVLLLAALSMAPTWGVRPQMFTLLLASAFLYILEQHRQRLWLLPLLMVLWVNLHSGYALGLVIIAIYLFGETVEASRASCTLGHTAFSLRVAHFTVHVSRPLALVLVWCCVAVLFNPNGATMYVYPFETLTSRAMQAYIQEWFSPDFHRVEFQPFAWLLLSTLAAQALSGKRLSLTQTLLLVGLGYAALRSARHISIFAIVAAPILAEQVEHLVRARLAVPPPRVTRGSVLVNGLILVLFVVASGARIVAVMNNQSNVERARFPAAAVDFLQTHAARGALYNTYAWGGYLIWRLYPQMQVFIDGRADVYGDAFIEGVYLQVYRGGDNWRAILDQYAVDFVLLEPSAPLVAHLARDPQWQRIYADAQAVLFQRVSLTGKP